MNEKHEDEKDKPQRRKGRKGKQFLVVSDWMIG